MAKATLAQGIEVLLMIERGDYDREMVQAIIDKRVVIKPPATAYRGDGPRGVSEVAGEMREHHYAIQVVSAVLPTYAALIANYGMHKVSGTWNERESRLQLHGSLRDLTPPTGEVTVFLKKFDQVTTSERAIKWADEHNYRLVFPWEREAFSSANPELQRKFFIVDLGSYAIRHPGGGRFVPTLCGNDSGRELSDAWFDDEWRATCRFLFASK